MLLESVGRQRQPRFCESETNYLVSAGQTEGKLPRCAGVLLLQPPGDFVEEGREIVDPNHHRLSTRLPSFRHIPLEQLAQHSFGQPDINIDHHITNLSFARLNLVEPDAAATAEIIAQSLSVWDLPLNSEVSDALLTGLIADTIGFRTSNVNGRVLRVAADLVEAGSSLSYLYRRTLLQKSINAARYWGNGLVNLRFEDGIVWTSLTLADRKAADYPGRDDADLINLLSFLNEAEVAIIFIEQPDNIVKVSWRAQNGKDVSQVAVRFGGGGHRAASGAEVMGMLSEVQLQVLNATRELFIQERVSDEKR